MSQPSNKNQGNSGKKGKLSALNPLQIPKQTIAAEDEPNKGTLDQYGNMVSNHTIPATTSASNSAEEQYEKELAELQLDPGYNLRTHFNECTAMMANEDSRKPPTLEQLKTEYSKISKGDILSHIKQSANWICAGAELSINKKEGSIKVAEELQKKWSSCDSRLSREPAQSAAVRDHLKELKKREIDDLREMLADAFGDMNKRLEPASEPDRGLPTVKSGASTPELRKDWY